MSPLTSLMSPLASLVSPFLSPLLSLVSSLAHLLTALVETTAASATTTTTTAATTATTTETSRGRGEVACDGSKRIRGGSRGGSRGSTALGVGGVLTTEDQLAERECRVFAGSHSTAGAGAGASRTEQADLLTNEVSERAGSRVEDTAAVGGVIGLPGAGGERLSAKLSVGKGSCRLDAESVGGVSETTELSHNLNSSACAVEVLLQEHATELGVGGTRRRGVSVGVANVEVAATATSTSASSSTAGISLADEGSSANCRDSKFEHIHFNYYKLRTDRPTPFSNEDAHSY